MSPFLIPIILFLSTAAVFIVWLTVRHRERLAIVEKGLSSEDIKAIYGKEVKKDPLRSLKWGILFVFTGAAIVLGSVLDVYYNAEGGVVVGLVAVFIGAGLLLFYRIASKKIKEM